MGIIIFSEVGERRNITQMAANSEFLLNGTIGIVDNQSLLSFDYTYVNDKLSCMVSIWYAHIVFCYLVFFAGIAAILSRLLPSRFKFIHQWCGRAYIAFMILNIGVSIVIHNEGLPIAVLISFIWVLGAMILAWFLVLIYKMLHQRKVEERVDAKIRADGLGKSTLAEVMSAESAKILEEQSFWKRLLSLKGLHGVLMFVSWVNVMGRVFASNQSEFRCYTAPAYKPITNLTGFIPYSDPNYDTLPWARLGGTAAWGAVLFFAPFIAAYLFAMGYIWVTGLIRKRKGTEDVVSEAD